MEALSAHRSLAGALDGQGMKGYIFSSDPSARSYVTLWSLFMASMGAFGAYNGFTNPGAWWIGLISLAVSFLYISLLVRTWDQFRDVFVDFAGVTIVHNDSERTFSWHDVTECSRVSRALPVPRDKWSLVRIYRLFVIGDDTIAYFVPDTTVGRLIGNREDMIQMIKRQIAQAHGE